MRRNKRAIRLINIWMALSAHRIDHAAALLWRPDGEVLHRGRGRPPQSRHCPADEESRIAPGFIKKRIQMALPIRTTGPSIGEITMLKSQWHSLITSPIANVRQTSDCLFHVSPLDTVPLHLFLNHSDLYTMHKHCKQHGKAATCKDTAQETDLPFMTIETNVALSKSLKYMPFEWLHKKSAGRISRNLAWYRTCVPENVKAKLD